MRPFLVGTTWFFFVFAAALAHFLKVPVQQPVLIARSAIPLPAATAVRESPRPVARTSVPPLARAWQPLPEEPEPVSASEEEPDGQVETETQPRPVTHRMLQQMLPSASPTPRTPRPRARQASAPQSEPDLPEIPGDPVGRCLMCGAPADSWTEIEGQRLGYCRKHLTKPSRPSSGSTSRSARTRRQDDLPPGVGSGGADPDAEESGGQQGASTSQGGAKVQCRGATKAGRQCRRNTTEPSGYCYQHRGNR